MICFSSSTETNLVKHQSYGYGLTVWPKSVMKVFGSNYHPSCSRGLRPLSLRPCSKRASMHKKDTNVKAFYTVTTMKCYKRSLEALDSKVPLHENSARLSKNTNPREASALRSFSDKFLLPRCSDVMHVPQTHRCRSTQNDHNRLQLAKMVCELHVPETYKA